ncbi:MAG: hypothetical protein ACPL5F_01390 [Moorellaceae bacterium]
MSLAIPTNRDNIPLNAYAPIPHSPAEDAAVVYRMQKAMGVDADRITSDGRVMPRSYDALLRKGSRLTRKLNGDAHLALFEAAIEMGAESMGLPHPWISYDLARYGKPVSLRKSFFNNLGRYYFGPTFYGDQVMADLAKAMATTNLGGSFGDMTPLRLQNLDATMTSILYEEQHFVLWNWLERVPSIQPYYEWNTRVSYGDDRSFPAFVEGGTPPGATAQFQRNGVYIRYFGTRRGITHQMALTGQLGGSMVDPVAEENRDGAMALLARCEHNFIWGDHNITDNYGNIVNFDGIVKALENGTQYVGPSQVTTLANYTPGQNILDMEGKYIDFSILEEVARNLAEAGYVTNFRNVRAFMSPSVLADLSNIKMVSEFKLLPQLQPYGYYPGAPLAGYQSNFGFIPFTFSLFLKRAGMTDQPPRQAGMLSPATPSLTAAAGAPGTGVTSYFKSTNKAGGTDAGTYYYWVTAGNDASESAPSASASVTVQAGQVVTITITPGASNGQPQTYYRVYRGTVNDPYDKNTGCIANVPANGSNPVTFTDTNSWRPQTGMLLLLERSPENLCVAQMCPMMKWPLAITSTTVEWLILLYHTLVVKAPQRAFLIKNIGRLNL